jgi:hypothetical protein
MVWDTTKEVFRRKDSLFKNGKKEVCGLLGFFGSLEKSLIESQNTEAG